jgi:DNA-binding SARP family transcriptional activator
VEFGLLGPVEVWHRGRRLPSGSGRERFVLATLLLNADRPTPAGELIGPLWADPPASAKAQLHNLVSSLRRRLRDADPDLIETRPAGYQLRLGAHPLDLAEFRRLVALAGRDAEAGDHRAAAEGYAAALALWRGAALADVPDELAAGARAALHEERLAAAEAALDPALALGRYDEVLRAVAALLAEHPYRERLYHRQMLALIGAGRRADALAAYRAAYRRMVDDLGVEPGPELRELAGRVLRGGAPTVPAYPVPRQLPAAITPLTGRDALVGAVAAELRRTAGPAPPVVLLVGPGGIGKTAVALAAAREVLDGYPDGQLHADLRGTHQEPADPHAVLARFLRALGVPGPEVPDDPDERLATYRTVLAGRRVLVALDDAADEAQVRALLPGAPGCGVLVTSRRALLGLVGVARHPVPVLAPADAVLLLSRLAGPDRVTAEPAAAAAIAAGCGQLPLALCIAGARLSTRPDRSLADFRDRLAEHRHHLGAPRPDPGARLDELTAGDLDVRASIDLSYRALDPRLATFFRHLALITAPDWPAWTAHLLTSPTEPGPTGPDATETGSAEPVDGYLARLVEMHLVEVVGTDGVGQRRHRMHDLVAEFAAERGRAEDGAAERDAMVGRLLTGWLGAASLADEEFGISSAVTAGLVAPEPPAGAAEVARATPNEWFEAERAALLAAVEQASRHGRADLAGALALRVAPFLAKRSYDDDRAGALGTALAAVRVGGTDGMRGRLLGSLFSAYAQQDRLAELPALAAEQLDVARSVGDRQGEVRALMQLGMLARRQGRLAEAHRVLAEAADRCTGMPVLVHTTVLASRAAVYVAEGRPAVALPLAAEALERQRAERSPRMVGMRLAGYAEALLYTGDLDAAERALEECRALLCERDTDLAAGLIETRLAELDTRRGDLAGARRRLDRAMAVYDIHHDSGGRAEVLRCRGELAMAAGNPVQALAPLRESLALYRRIGQPLDEAGLLARLARAHEAGGTPTAAANNTARYQAILTDLALDTTALRLPD